MNHFEQLYKEKGVSSQRRYPNESLLVFFGSHYFHLSPEERKKISVLELGCGSGANLWMVAREGFDAYGIDNAPTGIKLCKNVLGNWGVKANLSMGDMQAVGFEDERFDVIFDVVSMQHLDLKGHRRAYKEIYRCLKEGGRFFQYHLGTQSDSFKGHHIDELTIDNIPAGLPLTGSGLTCFLNPPKAQEMLEQAGFKDINIESRTRTYKTRTQLVEYLAISALK